MAPVRRKRKFRQLALEHVSMCRSVAIVANNRDSNKANDKKPGPERVAHGVFQ